MAGGTFTSQNKIRPGAYINIKGVPKSQSTVGSRGIVTMPVSLEWGEVGKIIPISSLKFMEGNHVEDIGYYGHEKECQSIREALRNSHTLLLYRLDTDSTKATGTVGTLTLTAKYAGTVGNRISVIIKELEDSKFEVNILLDNKVKDIQVAENVEDLVDNAWVVFSGTGKLTASAGKTLEGATSGTIDTENYLDYIKLIKTKVFNTMGVYTDTPLIKQKMAEFIHSLREDKGKKVQIVLNEFTSKDYEGVISVSQGYKTDIETVSVEGFVGYIAGLTAGTDVDQSNTYHVIEGAIEIINPIDDEEIKEALLKGQLVLSYRSDEKVIIEQDINTLTTFTNEKPKSFSKNRVIRTLDDIANQSKLLWEKIFTGKIDNDDKGRALYKSEILSYLKLLESLGAIKDVRPEDIVVEQGNDIDSVIVEIYVFPVDAMEKLYQTINVG